MAFLPPATSPRGSAAPTSGLTGRRDRARGRVSLGRAAALAAIWWSALALVALTALPAQADVKANPQAWRGKPVASPKASSQQCADFVFVGVRGSGEEAGYGPTVTGIRDALASRWTGGSVRQVWLDYPAADPHTLTSVPIERLLFDDPMPTTEYFGSADAGARELAGVLADSLRRCPGERSILVGFSQGAQVITQALSASAAATDQLAAAILLGNPFHYPGQSVRELSGDAPASALGLGAVLQVLRYQAVTGDKSSREQAVTNLLTTLISQHQGTFSETQVRAALSGTGAALPPGAYAHTYSVCQSGDLVCDAVPAMTSVLLQNSTMDEEFTKTRPIHLGYSANLLKATVDQVMTDIEALPPAARPVATPKPQSPVQPQGRRTAWWVLAVGAVAAVAVGFGTGHWHAAGRRRRVESAATASSSDSPSSPVDPRSAASAASASSADPHPEGPAVSTDSSIRAGHAADPAGRGEAD